MKQNTIKFELESKIAFLKSKQEQDFNDLRNQYYATVESIKPINLIKSVTREFISSPSLKSNLINGAIGIGTSYFLKNLMYENSTSPIKRVLGKVLKFAIKNFIGKKSQKI